VEIIDQGQVDVACTEWTEVKEIGC